MPKYKIRKSLTLEDKEAARRSVELLNESLAERFGNDQNVQIIAWASDLHLHADAGYEGLGNMYTQLVDTNRQFLLAMHEIEALRPHADLLILGGDLTDKSTPEEWQTFRKLLDESSWSGPVIPAFGNHDNGDPRAEAGSRVRQMWSSIKRDEWPELSEPNELYYSRVHQGVRYIVLDTLSSPEHKISDPQKNWLRRELENADIPTIVVCHRHQLNVGNWVDDLLYREKEVWEMLDKCPAVLGVFSGHVHYSRLWQYRRKLYGTFPAVAYGIGGNTGWGGIVVKDGRIATVFRKELYGETLEMYTRLQHKKGQFVFMEPELFQSSLFCKPSYWPWEGDPEKRD